MARLFTLGVVNATIVLAVHWTEFWTPFPKPTLTIVLVASTKCNFCGQAENAYALSALRWTDTSHVLHHHITMCMIHSHKLWTHLYWVRVSQLFILTVCCFLSRLRLGKKRHRVQVKWCWQVAEVALLHYDTKLKTLIMFCIGCRKSISTADTSPAVLERSQADTEWVTTLLELIWQDFEREFVVRKGPN